MPTSSPFATALAAAVADADAASGHPPFCTIGELLRGLDEADAAKVVELFGSKRNHTTVAAALSTVTGTRIAASTVSRHRRGGCRCRR